MSSYSKQRTGRNHRKHRKTRKLVFQENKWKFADLYEAVLGNIRNTHKQWVQHNFGVVLFH